MKNTYEVTKVLKGGADEIGSDIHGLTIRTNQIVWDIVKVLNQAEYEDFHVVANISSKKTIIVLYHKDIEIAKMAKKEIEDRMNCADFLMMARVKKKKKSRFSKRVILFLLTIIAVISFIAYLLIYKLEIFNKEASIIKKEQVKVVRKVALHNDVVKVELDLKKINLIKDTFIDQKSDLQKNIMKSMETTVDVISMLVPQSEKDKYSTKELLKNFQEKGGIEFVLKNPTNSAEALKELNAYAIDSLANDKEGKLLKAYQKLIEGKVDKESKKSNEEELEKTLSTLDNYAKEMIKDQNTTKLIEKYQKVLDQNSSLKDKEFLDEFFKQKDVNRTLQELNSYIKKDITLENKNSKAVHKKLKNNKKIPKKELVIAYNMMGKLYKNKGNLAKSKLFYEESLTLSKSLLEKDELLSLSSQAYNLVELSHLYNEFEENPISKENLSDAHEMYLKIVTIYRKLSSEKKELKERLAGSLNTLANFYHSEMLDYNQSIKTREEALKIYEELYKEDSKLFRRVVYQTRDSLAESYMFLNEFKKAKKLYFESLKLVDDEVKKSNNQNDILVSAMIHHDIAWVELFMNHFYKGEKEIRETLSRANMLKKNKKELQALGYFYLAYSAYLQQEIDEAIDYSIKSAFFLKSYKSDKFYLTLLMLKKDDKEVELLFKKMLKKYKRYDYQEELKREYVNYKLLKSIKSLQQKKESQKK